MSSNVFKIVEHIVPCQHVRDYPQATAYEQEDVLHMAVKQYIPLNNPSPRPGDLTVIAAHACGFPKELYEPLWEEILTRAESRKLRVRSIWIADIAQQGASGVLNEELLGNDPSWADHARDLLHLINLKRDQMPRPIVGIGHSMGGTQLVNVAYMHPQLFTTLVLIDPAMGLLSSTPPEAGPNPGMLSTYRKELWPSRDAAAEEFKSSRFYRKWDPRVLDRWIKYGLRDLPTPIHHHDTTSSENKKKGVTLTTTKHQEVFTFVRPNFAGYGPDKPPDRRTHADLNPSLPPSSTFPFYRADSPLTFLRLSSLRPSVLYIFGGASDVSRPKDRQAKMDTTGVGVGGSGGYPAGRVESVTLDGAGHLIPMEDVGRTADAAADWLALEMQRWREEEEGFRKVWDAKPIQEKRMIDDRWREMMGPLPASGKKKKKPAVGGLKL